MNRKKSLTAKVFLTAFLVLCACPWEISASQTGDNLTVSGIVTDAQGKAVKAKETVIRGVINDSNRLF